MTVRTIFLTLYPLTHQGSYFDASHRASYLGTSYLLWVRHPAPQFIVLAQHFSKQERLLLHATLWPSRRHPWYNYRFLSDETSFRSPMMQYRSERRYASWSHSFRCVIYLQLHCKTIADSNLTGTGTLLCGMSVSLARGSDPIWENLSEFLAPSVFRIIKAWLHL